MLQDQEAYDKEIEEFSLSFKKMVPGDGIEPPTLSSSGSRSTTELPRPK